MLTKGIVYFETFYLLLEASLNKFILLRILITKINYAITQPIKVDEPWNDSYSSIYRQASKTFAVFHRKGKIKHLKFFLAN